MFLGGWWKKGSWGLTFPIARYFQCPYHGYRHCPYYDVLENAPCAVEYVHHDEIHTSHGVVEYLGYIPIVRNGMALEDVPLDPGVSSLCSDFGRWTHDYGGG